jgi:[protein-PII] uridylyltransferase
LTRLLPEWESLDCRVQHEYYHRYTADIHTLKTIRELDKVFSGQDKDLTGKYRTALHQTEMPGLLYLILLLHDIGKGVSVQGHAERGAVMARPILQRLGVNVDLHEKILAIIRLHLEMARFWQHYDVDDPRTAQSFAKRVESPELLRLLYVHTYCDARGTADGLWNSYKDSLHSRLFNVTLAAFGEQPPAPEQLTMIPKDTLRAKVPHLNEDEIEAHYNLMPERYFIYNNVEEVALHLRMVNDLLQSIADSSSMGSLEPVIDWHDDLSLSMTVVNIVTWDRAGLFYKLAGAFSVAGLSIVSSKAITRADHITIDTFFVCESNGGVVQDSTARQVFEEHLHKALLQNFELMPAIENTARRLRKPAYLRRNEQLRAPIPATVDVYHELSLRRTIIEIQAMDHLGLLYQITKAIYDHGFDISFARVATERSAAMDTFYIEKIDRRTKEDAADLLALREALSKIVLENAPDQQNSRAAAG